jgi:hypothetical protein
VSGVRAGNRLITQLADGTVRSVAAGTGRKKLERPRQGVEKQPSLFEESCLDADEKK